MYVHQQQGSRDKHEMLNCTVAVLRIIMSIMRISIIMSMSIMRIIMLSFGHGMKNHLLRSSSVVSSHAA
jgi:hypothetical protein